jgi:hypothetical protein
MKPHERNPLMEFFPVFLFTHSTPFFSSHQSSPSLPPSLPPSLYLRTNKEASHKLPSLPALILLLLLFPLPKCPSFHPFDETLPKPISFLMKIIRILN